MAEKKIVETPVPFEIQKDIDTLFSVIDHEKDPIYQSIQRAFRKQYPEAEEDPYGRLLDSCRLPKL